MFDGNSSKGQTGVVTAVLLSGLVIAGITAALTWGLPLLRKNQDTQNLENALTEMRSLSSEIEQIASRGGSTKFSLNLNQGSIFIDTANNTITYSVTTNAAYVSTREWVPLNERDMRGIARVDKSDSYGVVGQDKAGVVIGKAFQRGEEYNTRYAIVFRELDDIETDTGYQIDLVKDGSISASGGQRTFHISKQTEETLPGESKRGGLLVQRKILVRVE